MTVNHRVASSSLAWGATTAGPPPGGHATIEAGPGGFPPGPLPFRASMAARRPPAGRRLYHLRQEQGRHESDILAEISATQVIAIEVKANAAPRASDARHPTWLRDQLGKRFVRGVVLHTGPRAYELENVSSRRQSPRSGHTRPHPEENEGRAPPPAGVAPTIAPTAARRSSPAPRPRLPSAPAGSRRRTVRYWHTPALKSHCSGTAARRPSNDRRS